MFFTQNYLVPLKITRTIENSKLVKKRNKVLTFGFYCVAIQKVTPTMSFGIEILLRKYNKLTKSVKTDIALLFINSHLTGSKV